MSRRKNRDGIQSNYSVLWDVGWMDELRSTKHDEKLANLAVLRYYHAGWLEDTLNLGTILVRGGNFTLSSRGVNILVREFAKS
jgi:hypothetical protein